MKFKVIALVFLFFLSFKITGQIAYDKVLSPDYEKAAAFIQSEKWMLDTFVKYQLNPYFVLAIVFPELIRYSKLQDVIESNDLKVLYVQFGDTYSNFSIGRFQMKPSFCEQLEKDYNKYVTLQKKLLFNIQLFDVTQNPQNRKVRIYRMEHLVWQVRYLMIFVYLNNYYLNLLGNQSLSGLRLLATAYNVGYFKGINYIKSKQHLKEFHFSGSFKSVKNSFNYADISCYYYTQKLK